MHYNTKKILYVMMHFYSICMYVLLHFCINIAFSTVVTIFTLTFLALKVSIDAEVCVNKAGDVCMTEPCFAFA